MNNANHLQKFIEAQQSDYANALSEIKSGRKRSHWMWYIFPQIQGLGFSDTSKLYALKGLQEAKDFLDHPVLGRQLINICNELLALKINDANAIFGSPDDMKLRSSMTLFSSVQNTHAVFRQVLDKFFNGIADQRTVHIIKKL